MVSREARDTAGEAPTLPGSSFSPEIPPAFVPRLRDYGLAGDFPPSPR